MNLFKTKFLLAYAMFFLPLIIQAQTNDKAPPSHVMSVVGKRYDGSLPGITGRRYYGWSLYIKSIADDRVSGNIVLNYPDCSGEVPMTGTISGIEMDLTATGSNRCEGTWKMYLTIHEGGRTLVGKMHRSNGSIVDITIK